MTATASRLIEPTFWTQTLEDRMAEFAEIRELGAVLPIEVVNPMAGDTAETIYALPRFDEVVHVSKHPDQFCSGEGCHVGVRPADGDARVLRRVHQHGQPAPRPPAPDRRPQLHPGRAAGRARVGRVDLHRGDRRVLRAGRGRPGRGAVAAVPAADHLRHDGHSRAASSRRCSTPPTSSSAAATPSSSARTAASKRSSTPACRWPR